MFPVSLLPMSPVHTAIELGGTAQGSEYDRLLVGGSMLLGNAQLVLSFINSFENRALSSDVFILAEAGSISGSFANAASGSRLSTVDGFGSFLVSYGQGSAFNADAVVLSESAAVPEPSAAILCIAGMVSVTLRRRRPSYRRFGVVV